MLPYRALRFANTNSRSIWPLHVVHAYSYYDNPDAIEDRAERESPA
jgi:hypothetical protein